MGEGLVSCYPCLENDFVIIVMDLKGKQTFFLDSYKNSEWDKFSQIYYIKVRNSDLFADRIIKDTRP